MWLTLQFFVYRIQPRYAAFAFLADGIHKMNRPLPRSHTERLGNAVEKDPLHQEYGVDTDSLGFLWDNLEKYRFPS